MNYNKIREEAELYASNFSRDSLAYREAMIYSRYGGKLGIKICSEIAENSGED